MQTIAFSNGVTIDCDKIAHVESNQQKIQFPGDIGEMAHLLAGRPSGLLIRLRDGSTVEIKAGDQRLEIHSGDSR